MALFSKAGSSPGAQDVPDVASADGSIVPIDHGHYAIHIGLFGRFVRRPLTLRPLRRLRLLEPGEAGQVLNKTLPKVEVLARHIQDLLLAFQDADSAWELRPYVGWIREVESWNGSELSP